MFSRCVNCSFYVQRQIEYCPNCGLQNPTADLPEHKYVSPFIIQILKSPTTKLFLFVFITAILLVAFADFDVSNIAYLNNVVLVYVFILGIASAFSLPYLIKKIYMNFSKKEIVKTKHNLIDKEKLITKRIKELRKREQNIESTLKRIGKSSSPKLLETKEILLSAREVIMSQVLRYELQKKKIEIVRMQNNVSPFLFRNHQLNYDEVESGLNSIDSHIHRLYSFCQGYTQYDSDDFPNEIKDEKETFLSQVSETKNSFEKMCENLLAKQATLAFEDINPAKDTLSNELDSEDLIRESDIFNIQTSITDFSDSFDKLESEYQQLKTEDEVNQKLFND